MLYPVILRNNGNDEACEYRPCDIYCHELEFVGRTEGFAVMNSILLDVQKDSAGLDGSFGHDLSCRFSER